VLTQVNAAARALGLAAGMPLQRALRDLLTPVPRP
jgi:nucleotidyltransferase/DNA polymerase involved in DNA repair